MGTSFLRNTKYTYIMATTDSILQGVNVAGTINDFNGKILSKDALAFLALLHRSFNGTRKDLLQRRVIRQAELDKGSLPDFLPETRHIRENDAWRGSKARTRSDRPEGGDYRSNRPQDGCERIELECLDVHGRFRRFERSHLG